MHEVIAHLTIYIIYMYLNNIEIYDFNNSLLRYKSLGTLGGG